jgi:hypothetical protein
MIAVAIPCVPGTEEMPDRARNLRWVTDYYKHLGMRWDVAYVDPVSVAINQLAAKLEPWDVLAVTLSDCLIKPESFQQMVTLAAEAPGPVLGYTHICRLEETDMPTDMPQVFDRGRSFVPDYGISQVFALSRETFDAVGGWDEQFRGWGAEDYAMQVLFEARFGDTRRVPGLCWHLPHEPQATADPRHPALIANRERWARYLERQGNFDALMELKQGVLA